MPLRQDVIIYGYFETPGWPDAPTNAQPVVGEVTAAASVPSPTLHQDRDVPVDIEVFVGALVHQPTIQGIVSVVVGSDGLEFTEARAYAYIDDPVVDVTGGGAAPSEVVASASIPGPAISISGGGAVFGGNFGGTF